MSSMGVAERSKLPSRKFRMPEIESSVTAAMLSRFADNLPNDTRSSAFTHQHSAAVAAHEVPLGALGEIFVDALHDVIPPRFTRPHAALPQPLVSSLRLHLVDAAPPSNQLRAKEGQASSLTFTATKATAPGSATRAPASGLYFFLRWLGGSLLPVEVSESISRPGEYVAAFTAFDSGSYELEGLLMWEDPGLAFGPRVPPHLLREFYTQGSEARRRYAQKPPLLRRLLLRRGPGREGVSQALARLLVEPAGGGNKGRVTAASSACSASQIGGLSGLEGRWTAPAPSSSPAVSAPVAAPRDWSEWRPASGCRLLRYSAQEAAACLAPPDEESPSAARGPGGIGNGTHSSGVRLLLVGDSHTRVVAEALKALEMPRAAPAAAGPRVQHVFTQAVRDLRESNGAGNAGARFLFPGQPSSAVRALTASSSWVEMQLSSSSSSSGSIGGDGDATHVVMNFGHWDLRDTDADTHVKEVLELLGGVFERLRERGWAGTFIWRTAPSYSFLRDLWKDQEFRTNEKLADARRSVLGGLAALVASREWPFAVRVMDSFAVTSPRFLETPDTHHYLQLGPRGPQPGAADGVWEGLRNQVGVADLQLLVNILCNG